MFVEYFIILSSLMGGNLIRNDLIALSAFCKYLIV